ncbi:MAG TPA: PIN domain-containing protein [Candidatus Acidoferrum sp.]|nr:PIN domain-containing protein [Candidatus Acidoferrum sp.]
MGIILDSSVIIAAERRGHTVLEILDQVRSSQGEIDIGVSVVSIAELVHGAYRAKTEGQLQRRLEFIERLSNDVPVYPVTLDIARLAGRIEGQQQAKGIQLAFEDLLIGVTALHLGYAVATLNLRDFKQLPGLSVVQL